MADRPTPVPALSGLVGAGKTTLHDVVLATGEDRECAVFDGAPALCPRRQGLFTPRCDTSPIL